MKPNGRTACSLPFTTALSSLRNPVSFSVDWRQYYIHGPSRTTAAAETRRALTRPRTQDVSHAQDTSIASALFAGCSADHSINEFFTTFCCSRRLFLCWSRLASTSNSIAHFSSDFVSTEACSSEYTNQSLGHHSGIALAF
jgi:hypothetical protein